jgi:hypothetical protein
MKRKIKLHLTCGHVRETRSTYDEDEINHPERWILTNAWCDRCNQPVTVTLISRVVKDGE